MESNLLLTGETDDVFISDVSSECKWVKVEVDFFVSDGGIVCNQAHRIDRKYTQYIVDLLYFFIFSLLLLSFAASASSCQLLAIFKLILYSLLGQSLPTYQYQQREFINQKKKYFQKLEVVLCMQQKQQQLGSASASTSTRIQNSLLRSMSLVTSTSSTLLRLSLKSQQLKDS